MNRPVVPREALVNLHADLSRKSMRLLTDGEIVAIYPDRALIKFKRKPTMIEKTKGIKDDVEDQIEVPFVNIAKK